MYLREAYELGLGLLPALPYHVTASPRDCIAMLRQCRTAGFFFFFFHLTQFLPSLFLDVLAVERTVIVEGDTKECLNLGGKPAF